MMQARNGGNRIWWVVIPVVAAAGLGLTIVLARGSSPEPSSDPGPGSAATSSSPTGSAPPTTSPTTMDRATDSSSGSDPTADQPTGTLVSAYRPEGTSGDEPEASPVERTNGGDSHTSPGFTAAWDADGRHLLVTRFGSSSCATGLDRIVVTGPQRLELSSSIEASGVVRSCTADLAPFTSDIAVPDDIRNDAELTIVIGSRQLALPAQR